MYNSLSNHLNSRLNTVIINEGFWDKLFGGNTKEGKGFLGTLGSLFSAITGDEDDELSKALKKQEEDAEKNAKKREEDLAKSAEGALIAKLKADFEQKENQLTLANKRKIDAYKAQKQQFEQNAKFWKANKREYTSEQLEACQRVREELWAGIGAMGGNELEEFNRLATIITTDAEGNTLSMEDVRKKISLKENDEGYDPEFAAQYARFKKLGEKYKKPMLDACTSAEYAEYAGKAPIYANELGNAKSEVETLRKQAVEFDAKAQAVSKYKAAEKEYNDAQTELQQASEAVEKFGANNPYVDIDGTGKAVAKTDANFQAMLKPIGTISSAEDIDAHCQKLKEAGVPDSIVDVVKQAGMGAIQSGEGEVTVGDAAKAMGEAAAALDQDQLAELERCIVDHEQTKYNEAVAKRKQAQVKVDNSGKPDKANYPEIAKMTDEEMINYDVTTDVGKENKETITKEVKEAETKLTEIEDARKTRKEKRAALISAQKAEAKGKVPEELEADVNKLNQGVELGETKTADGKVGIKVPEKGDDGKVKKDADGNVIYKFMEKPGPGEDGTEYDKAKKELVLGMNLDDVKTHEIKKDGDKYKLVKADGTEEVIDRDKAVELYAENARHAADRNELLGQKQAIAKGISSCITSEGDLDPEAWKAMDENQRAAIKKILAGEVDPEEYFKGVDISGTMTIDAVKEFKEAHTKKGAEFDEEGDSLLSYIEDIENVNDDDYDKAEFTKDDDDTSDDVEIEDDGDGTKKTLRNPAKEWKQRKKKNSEGKTSSYYNKEGDSISKKEFKKRQKRYQDALAKRKGSSTQTNTTTNNGGGKPQKMGDSKIDYTNLSNWLFEKLLNSI